MQTRNQNSNIIILLIKFLALKTFMVALFLTQQQNNMLEILSKPYFLIILITFYVLSRIKHDLLWQV